MEDAVPQKLPALREAHARSSLRDLGRLIKAYPKAVFILTVPRLNHEPRADTYLAEIAREVGANVQAFKMTGRGTNPHPGKAIHDEVAGQLFEFVQTLKMEW